MASFIIVLLLVVSWSSPVMTHTVRPAPVSQEQPTRIVTSYDAVKDKTTICLAPVQLSGPKGKYHSLHMAPFFSYPGKEPRTPEIIDFELRTVVKGKLRIDLYVLFIVDGEKIFMSSSRWAVKKWHLGRGWMGEHLVFRMPYDTFLKITRAKNVEITFDGFSFPVSEEHIQTLRELAGSIGNQEIPVSGGPASSPCKRVSS